MIELVREGVIPNTHNKQYIIDSATELSQLEADFGNEAYCIADKTTYICDGSGAYVEKKSGGGGQPTEEYREFVYKDLTAYDFDAGSPVALSSNTMTRSELAGFVRDNKKNPISIDFEYQGHSYTTLMAASYNQLVGSCADFSTYDGSERTLTIVLYIDEIRVYGRVIAQANENSASVDLSEYDFSDGEVTITDDFSPELLDMIVSGDILPNVSVWIEYNDLDYATSDYTVYGDEAIFRFRGRATATTLGSEFGLRIYMGGDDVKARIIS
jgi:hypothetical protein